MAKVLSSISGNLISAASAGYAPTNSADVSAIASAYQVVSATGTQLYAGTAHVTSINGAPISASRAGKAANASMANRAYYDGTGRLISALPDAATVSSIASSYAKSAASGKLDTTAQVVSATASDGIYITSINGMGLSGKGDGGAQVVTSTGSASATAGSWPYTTSYLVSSINGSGLLPYGYSAISGNSANWNDTRTTVFNNSANWNSVYTTVNLNSASWTGSTGGGGDVTSPSGTIFVQDGTAIEGTNSAVVVNQTSVGKTSILPLQGNAIGPTGMGVLTYGNLDESGMHLVFMLANAYHGNDATVIISGRDYNGNFASASGLIVEGDTSANIPLGTVQSQLYASSDYWINLMYGEDLSGVKAPGYAVTGVGELAWKSAVDNVTNTVSSNSASWGGGGVDITFDSSFTGSGTVESPVGLSGALILACPNNTAQQIRINTGYAAGIAIKATRSSYLGAEGLTASAGSITNRTSVECANWGIRFQSGAYNRTAIIDYPAVTSYSSKSANWDDVYTTVLSNSANWGAVPTSITAAPDPGNNSAWFDEHGVSAERQGIASSTLGARYLAIESYPNTDDFSSVYITPSLLEFSNSASTSTVNISSIDRWNTVSGKADSSALSSYALSADVSATVDVVSSQSANWGGSALALSAGPGVSLTKSGNTLVASTDETVLWSDSVGSATVTASENIFNFERCRVTYMGGAAIRGEVERDISSSITTYNLIFPYFRADSTNFIQFQCTTMTVSNNGTTVAFTDGKRLWLPPSAGSIGSDTQPIQCTKIVGINRTAGV